MVFPYLSVGNNEKDSKNFDRICEILDRLHTLVIGPGLGKNPETMDLTENIITKAKELNINLVFDAVVSFHNYNDHKRTNEKLQ